MFTKRELIVGLSLGVLLGITQLLNLQRTPEPIEQFPPLAELISDRIAWPTGVMLKTPRIVLIRDSGLLLGHARINAGVPLRALELSKDGILTIDYAGTRVHFYLGSPRPRKSHASES